MDTAIGAGYPSSTRRWADTSYRLCPVPLGKGGSWCARQTESSNLVLPQFEAQLLHLKGKKQILICRLDGQEAKTWWDTSLSHKLKLETAKYRQTVPWEVCLKSRVLVYATKWESIWFLVYLMGELSTKSVILLRNGWTFGVSVLITDQEETADELMIFFSVQIYILESGIPTTPSDRSCQGSFLFWLQQSRGVTGGA